MIERVLGLLAKEFRQILRDPRLARIIFVAPVIQLVVFGYAVSTDVWRTPTFVVDHDDTQASRELVEALTAPGYFRVIGRSDRSADMVRALDHGAAVIGLAIPPGFATALHGDAPAEVQILVDGTNSNTGTVAQGYAERIVQSYGAAVTERPPAGGVELHERAWYNAELASRDYNVPAVVGALIMLVCLVLTSLAVVRELEVGTLEQLRVSPLTPGELIAGKTVPFAVIGLIDITLVTAVAFAWFGVPFRGSFLVLFVASALYILSALGVGLLISTISKTQQEAFMASFLVFMPAILLSGFMFPVTSMPEPFQWITLLNPVRHYIEIVRAVFLKGVGVGTLWPQFGALLVTGVGLLWFAARRFKQTGSA